MTPQIRIQGLRRRFPGTDKSAVDDLSISVARGEVVCLVGPSGCGKSTTLRLVAGLDEPNAGVIEIGGRDMRAVPPQERDVAMVFQGFALYPHMKVRDILAFPLKMRGAARAERDKSVASAAELLGISRLLDRRPGELSGGEQQRVAMGRAIVRKPQVFLFDEPLSNLDAALRAELRVELGKLLRELSATALYVTHDQVEAMTLGHRIAVLRAGKIEQLDAPRRIYEAPASTFVAGFFGSPPMNLLAPERSADALCVGSLRVPAPPGAPAELVLGIRPERIRWHADSAGERAAGDCPFTARVTAVEPLGAESHVTLELAGQSVQSRVSGFDAPAVGSSVELAIARKDVRWFDRKTGLSVC
jgi:multiple sugar transport system ATP-binding protein